MDMVSVRDSIHPMKIDQNVGGVEGRGLDKFQPPLDGRGLSVAEPPRGHSLVPVDAIDQSACHPVTPMLGGVIVVNNYRTANN